jgi:hypothetical protein
MEQYKTIALNVMSTFEQAIAQWHDDNHSCLLPTLVNGTMIIILFAAKFGHA